MELREIVKDLMESRITENQELATTLLKAEDITEEERNQYIDSFIKDCLNKDSGIFSEEKAKLLENWVDLYLPTIEKNIKNRVKKI